MPAVFRTPISIFLAMLRHSLAVIALSLIISRGNCAHAENPSLLRWSEGALSIAIEENSALSATVSIGIGKGSLRAAFAVDNPSRLVFDLQGVQLRKGRALNVAAPALVQGLRLGVHEELIRLVIDCTGAVPPSFKVEGKTGRITIALKASQDTALLPPVESLLPTASSETTWPAVPSPSASPTAAPAITEIAQQPATTLSVLPPTEGSPLPSESVVEIPALVSPAVEATTLQSGSSLDASPSKPVAPAMETTPGSANISIPAIPTASPSPQATSTATPRPTKAARIPATPTTAPKVDHQPTPQVAAPPTVPTGTPAVPTGTPVIQGVSFEFLSAQRLPTIVVAASKRGEFKLSRADDRTFELLLPGYSLLTPQLALPQFPTDEFMGITFVKPEDTAQGVTIRIGVDHGTRVGAVWQDTRILITTRY